MLNIIIGEEFIVSRYWPKTRQSTPGTNRESWNMTCEYDESLMMQQATNDETGRIPNARVNNQPSPQASLRGMQSKDRAKRTTMQQSNDDV